MPFTFIDKDNKGNIYFLKDGTSFYSTLTSYLVEYVLFTNPNIKLEDLDKDDSTWNDKYYMAFYQCLTQNHLCQDCYNIETLLKREILQSDYHYKSGNEKFKSNFFVPHFFLYENMSEMPIINDVIDKESLKFVFNINHIIDRFFKYHIHIGIYSDFANESFAKRLKKLFEMSGYEVNFVDHEANCISNFMWDDSIYDTLTVLIGFCNNEEVVKNRIFDFISMDCSLNDDFFAGSLLYFSYNYQTKLFNSNEHNNIIPQNIFNSYPTIMGVDDDVPF